MTAANAPREPLDADERDLAARLARVGPFDQPSPALDARILAAAHAAAATRAPRRRWRLRIGMPPVLATGVGVAAAAVLALGLVWQLRPRTGVLMTHEAVGTGEDPFALAEPGTARAPVAGPPSFLAPPPPSPLPPLPTAPSAATAAGAAKARAAAAAEPAEPLRVVTAPATAKITPEAARDSGTPDVAAPAPRAPQVPETTVLAAPAEAAIEEEAGFVPTPSPAPAVPARRESRASHAPAAQAASYPGGPELPAAPAPEARIVEREEDDAVLERAAVTGSRLRQADVADSAPPWSAVPARDDARLEPGEWFARIRARRDAGDLDGARASLRLLRHEHPRVPVPDDLHALLDDAGP